MGFSESVLVAIFTLVVVFCVLMMLMFIIRLFSFILSSFMDKKINQSVRLNTETSSQHEMIADLKIEDIFSTGAIKLKNVDEPSAAMIMAIVSDESGIPLEELCFKSISLISK